jgi:hypothetical protein
MSLVDLLKHITGIFARRAQDKFLEDDDGGA